ncbi:hypothetical protein [Massilia sp. TSP1-1-2]|uniref:hypothetical protein n=1 Tax=unclassified Massilia TaxID=2609279 RepID=UPI003CF85BFD
MNAYLPALVWLLSNVICLGIAKHRNVKETALRTMTAALLGPMAIPWVLLAAPENLKPA